MRKIALFVCVLAYLCTSPLMARNTPVNTTKTPSWVKTISITYDHKKLEQQAEDGYFDIALIKQVNLPEQTIYTRKAFKVVNESGIENISEVSVTIDPSYQKLTFADIHITRDGKMIDKLKGAKFRHLQQETDAYLHQYDGRTTELLVLEDVRVGDVIEYAYSVKGFNPVFEGKYADFFYTAFSVPLGQIYYRIVNDADKQLIVENSNTDVAATEHKSGSTREYEWSFYDVPALHSDDQVPTWYDAYPLVMVSEYNDWLNIREWAVKLFPNYVVINKPLQASIEAIMKRYSRSEERAAAALRFVQDEIRYLGIEMGTGTHKPSDPNKTFERRYGDCKDKSYLLVTMLQAMNIPATPVLVNSSMKQSVARLTPSPKAFDHVTVRFTINGQHHFADATINNQRGPLEGISFPNYQSGLVLADSTAGLTSLVAPEKGMVRVKEVFNVPDLDGKATMQVTTINTGTFADDARSLFKNSSSYEVQKQYRDFYASYFEKIKADSIYYEDDEATGTFTVHEFYSINNFWAIEKGIKKANMYAFFINSYLKRPKDNMRTMPMAYYFPAKFKEEIEVNLPENWSLKDFDKEVASAVFRYSGKSTLTGRKLNMVFTFETVRDHVMPHEIDDLLASYKKIEDSMGWELTYNTKAGAQSPTASKGSEPLPAATRRNIAIRLTVFFALLSGGLFFALKRQRRTNELR